MLLVGDEPYYSRVGFKPVLIGRVTMPRPVDASRILVFELVDGAFEGVSTPAGATRARRWARLGHVLTGPTKPASRAASPRCRW